MASEHGPYRGKVNPIVKAASGTAILGEPLPPGNYDRAPDRWQDSIPGRRTKEYLSSADDVLSAQGADGESGLSEAAASERLAKHGPNKLKEEEKTPL